MTTSSSLRVVLETRSLLLLLIMVEFLMSRVPSWLQYYPGVIK